MLQLAAVWKILSIFFLVEIILLLMKANEQKEVNLEVLKILLATRIDTSQPRTFYQTADKAKVQERLLLTEYLLSLGFSELSSFSANCSLLFLHGHTDLRNLTRRLRQNQTSNHHYALDVIAFKGTLVFYPDLPAIPPAFQLPRDMEKLLKYSSNDPNAKFLTKSKQHHKIEFVQPQQNWTAIDKWKQSRFIQLFVDDLLLMDGHRFELDVYMLVTSVKPLRAYVQNDLVTLKFCKEKYHPFDQDNGDKFFVHQTFKEVPRVTAGFLAGKSQKQILEGLIADSGGSVADFWPYLDSILAEILLKTSVNPGGGDDDDSSSGRPFELLRVDFLLGNDLQLHILEFERVNLPIYYQMENLFGPMLDMVGFVAQDDEADDEILAESYHTTPAHSCQACDCSRPHLSLECAFCAKCLRPDDLMARADAVREKRAGRQFYRRIYPPSPITRPTGDAFEKVGRSNWLLQEWYARKCQGDESWC